MKRVLLYHFINGIRSGIPLCCTLFFMREYYNGNTCIADSVSKKRGFNPDAYYVQCDKCFYERRVVEIKHNGVIFLKLLKSGLQSRSV